MAFERTKRAFRRATERLRGRRSRLRTREDFVDFPPAEPVHTRPAGESRERSAARQVSPEREEELDAIISKGIAEGMRQKKPTSIWKRAKNAAIAGALVGTLYTGGRQNVSDAFTASERAQKDVANALVQERDQRGTFQKMLGRGTKPKPISVGKTWRTKRETGPNGMTYITEIGKDRIWAGVPRNLSWKPKVPFTPSTAKTVGKFALGFGALGAGLTAAGKLRRPRRGRR